MFFYKKLNGIFIANMCTKMKEKNKKFLLYRRLNVGPRVETIKDQKLEFILECNTYIGMLEKVSTYFCDKNKKYAFVIKKTVDGKIQERRMKSHLKKYGEPDNYSEIWTKIIYDPKEGRFKDTPYRHVDECSYNH